MVEPLRDPLDDTTLTRRVPLLENHGDLETLLLDPLLEVDQLFLKAKELVVVVLARDPTIRSVLVRHVVRLPGGLLRRCLGITPARRPEATNHVGSGSHAPGPRRLHRSRV